MTNDQRRVRRIAVGHAHAIHGVIFELDDGTRLGRFVEDNGIDMDLTQDHALQKRKKLTWFDIDADDHIEEVEFVGTNQQRFLAHSIVFVTKGRKEFRFHGQGCSWATKVSGSCKAHDGRAIVEVSFSGGEIHAFLTDSEYHPVRCCTSRNLPKATRHALDDNRELAFKQKLKPQKVKDPTLQATPTSPAHRNCLPAPPELLPRSRSRSPDAGKTSHVESKVETGVAKIAARNDLVEVALEDEDISSLATRENVETLSVGEQKSESAFHPKCGLETKEARKLENDVLRQLAKAGSKGIPLSTLGASVKLQQIFLPTSKARKKLKPWLQSLSGVELKNTEKGCMAYLTTPRRASLKRDVEAEAQLEKEVCHHISEAGPIGIGDLGNVNNFGIRFKALPNTGKWKEWLSSISSIILVIRKVGGQPKLLASLKSKKKKRAPLASTLSAKSSDTEVALERDVCNFIQEKGPMPISPLANQNQFGIRLKALRNGGGNWKKWLLGISDITLVTHQEMGTSTEFVCLKKNERLPLPLGSKNCVVSCTGEPPRSLDSVDPPAQMLRCSSRSRKRSRSRRKNRRGRSPSRRRRSRSKRKRSRSEQKRDRKQRERSQRKKKRRRSEEKQGRSRSRRKHSKKHSPARKKKRSQRHTKRHRSTSSGSSSSSSSRPSSSSAYSNVPLAPGRPTVNADSNSDEPQGLSQPMLQVHDASHSAHMTTESIDLYNAMGQDRHDETEDVMKDSDTALDVMIADCQPQHSGNAKTPRRELEEWLCRVDDQRGVIEQHRESILQHFGSLLELKACITQQAEPGVSVVQCVAPEVFEELGIRSLGHKLVLAKAILSLE